MAEARSAESATIALPVPKIDVDVSLQQIYEHLAQEGFRPKIDEDGSIGFKCEGWKLYLDPYQAGGGFRLYCCVFWELDSAERTKCIDIANDLNADRRCVKAFVNSNNTVWSPTKRTALRRRNTAEPWCLQLNSSLAPAVSIASCIDASHSL